MKKNFKRTLVMLSFFALASTFTSCNRGYGCPNNFSIGDTITEVVKATVSQLFVKP